MRNGSRRRSPATAVVAALEPRVLFHGDPSADGGLVGTYFNNPDFSAPALSRRDQTLNFYWGNDPPAASVNAETFSARWTGKLIGDGDETYTFTLRANGGVKLVVGGQVLIDALSAPDGTFADHTAMIPLTQDTPVDIEVDYFNQTGPAGIRLYWETSTISKEIVPADHLDPNTATPPAAPPLAPTNVAAAPISASQARITWTDAASNETAYQILRSANLGRATIIGVTDADATEFVDSGLTPGARYFYRVRAISPIGNSGWADYANAVSDGVGAPITPPTAPASLAANVINQTIQLTWEIQSADATQFIVERNGAEDDPGVFAPVATLPANSTTYTDSDVSPNVAYTYRIRATNLGGSTVSSTVTETVITGLPSGALRWHAVAPMPIGRSEAHGAVIDGKLYVFGGYVDLTYHPNSRADMYDPATDKWTRIADLPEGLTHCGVASDGRVVYFAGGYPPGTNGHTQTFATTHVFFYDPTTNTYNDLPSLPSARGGGALVLDGRILHFFGGSDINRADTPTHWSLDLDNLSAGWMTLAPLPAARNHIGGAALDGKIYAIGGQLLQDQAAIFRDDVDVYDPATDKWTPAASLPVPRSHITNAIVVRDGKILALGGQVSGPRPSNFVSQYDPATDRWTNLTPLPGNRLSGVAANLGTGLIFAGGSGNGFNTTTWIGSFD